MPLHPEIARVTDRIIERSAARRGRYMEIIRAQIDKGPKRAHLSCSSQAHAYAGAGPDQAALATKPGPNIGIVTAYNDMLSAHQPFERFPDLIRAAARAEGATAQVAGHPGRNRHGAVAFLARRDRARHRGRAVAQHL